MNPRFRDRAHAGRLLAVRVAEAAAAPCVVAAVPRGGVAVGRPVADWLGCPFTLAFVRKVPLPAAVEYAVGALDEEGHLHVRAEAADLLHASPGEIQRARGRVYEELLRQRGRYRVPSLSDLAPGRTVVVVDDGVVTGVTMQAAIGWARRLGATRVVAAAPCASAAVARHLEALADRFVAIYVDEDFFAVAEYYRKLEPMSDAEVDACFATARAGER